MNKFFGTDGIRAVFNEYPLQEEFVKKLGFCAFDVMSKETGDKDGPVFIGSDTRGSCEIIKNWLSFGLKAAGASQIIDLEVCPTPAVSCLTKKHNALFGIVISASHNPPQFNGIKFFNAMGRKLSLKTEERIEQKLLEDFNLPVLENTKIKKDPVVLADYSNFLQKVFTDKADNLNGFKLVVDCGNGAAYKIAPELFRRLGADVSVIGCKPDGENINLECGSLYTERLQQEVVKQNADCGISFDGDADRIIFSDNKGRSFDGDDIISMAAVELKAQGKLKNNKVVLTKMANYGLIKYLKDNEIDSVTVDVGDKYVTEKLDELELSLGGESSGHIIFHDLSPTGDGILTAVEILYMLKNSGKKLSEFKDKWKKYPSILKAVTVTEKIPLVDIKGFEGRIRMFQNQLNGEGRIFVRYSGTEPKLRILAEGPDEKVLEKITKDLINYYKESVAVKSGGS